MLTLPNNHRSSNPKIKVDKKGNWFIFFTFYDDNTGQKKAVTIKGGINRIANLKERQKRAQELLTGHLKLLKQGVNYITYQTTPENNETATTSTGFTAALNLALQSLDIEHATRLDIKSCLKSFSAALLGLNLSGKPIGQVSRRDVKTALDRATINKSAKTYNRYRKYLNILFKYLVEIMAIDTNPVRDISVKSTVTQTKETLTRQQRKNIDRHLKAKGLHTFRLFNRIFFTSGSRLTELLKIKAKDVNLTEQWYFVTIKKGKNRRVIKKTISNYAILYWQYALRNANKEDYIFSENLEPGIKPIKSAQITRRWKNHVKDELGITADLYSNRHSFATELSAKYGEDIAANQLQHTSTAMVRKIYNVDRWQMEHEKNKQVKVIY